MKELEKIYVSAPGRICLFGDHQDYLGLPIIACAINRSIKLKAISNKNHAIHIRLPDINEERIFDLQKPFISISNRDYFYSTLIVLKRVGCIPNKGYDVEISGNIPINAGLSSSSAVIVAWITFLLKAFGSNQTINPEFIADLAFKAEVIEYNGPGGLMDQYSISIGNTIFLNTQDGSYKKIDRKLESLIIGESGVPKQTLSVLKNLRAYALESISSVQANVCDFKIESATLEDYELYKKHVPNHLQPIFYAAIKNHLITKKAFQELSKDFFDINVVGSLMTDHHIILKDILKITVPIIDDMIDGALSNGALGAKIVGSGGGGSIVALTSAKNEAKVIKGIIDAGAKTAYKVNIVNGVSTL